MTGALRALLPDLKVLSFLLATALSAQAGLLSISKSTLGAGGGELVNAGTVQFAWNVNGTAVSSPLINGIAFANAQPSAVVLAGFPAAVTNDAMTSGHYTGGMAEVMGGYDGTAIGVNGTVTITGLTSGAVYRVQFFSHQDVNNDSTRQMEIHFGTASGTGSGTFACGNDLGYITTAMFVADATSQLFTFRVGSDDRAILNGVVLQLLPDFPVVNLTTMPKPMQLCPRDLNTGFGMVSIAGMVLSSNCTSASVTVNRAGSAYTNVTQLLTYSGSQAPFSITIPIRAELAGYDFTLQVTRDGTPYTITTVTNVVAGDVFLINGQSNAEAIMRNGSANANQSPWVRSFGYRGSTSGETQGDLNWHLAEGDVRAGAGAVGQWGLRMGRVLMESNGIPVCIINQAYPGQPISYFQGNDSAPGNPAINYGQLLYRVQQAGLQNAVRAILWYQGESDNGAAAVHENGWLELYRHWLRDYPTVEKIYVCQLHNAVCSSENRDLRNRQRLWEGAYDKVVVVSTTGIPSHTDNCHYGYDPGYRQLGEQIARLVRRDLYGVAQSSQIAPPNIQCAYLTDASGLNVTLATRNPADVLGFGSGIGNDFAVEGLPAATVLMATAASNTIQLTFSMDVRLGTGLSFTNHFGGAPFLTNSLGVGMLSFYKQPILTSLAIPGVPVGVVVAPVSSNRLDLAWATVTNASHYLIRRDGIIIGTAYQPFFSDTITGTHTYDLAAVSPVGTSSWSSAVSAATAAHNVFVNVPEAADYDLLYELDLLGDFQVGSTLDVPYSINNSGSYTAGIQRVAYYMELQDQPGNPMRWVYASMTAFTNNPAFLGVPVLLKGRSFQTYVQDMNVFASTNAGIVTGQHIATGNLEFWGYSYNTTNAAAVPGASSSAWDFGDQISTSGMYGSMQLHNYAAGQTLFAFNRWSTSGLDDIGIGNCTFTNADWTFAGNAQTWDVKRLYVLALIDADNDGIPDAWLEKYFGHRTGAAGDLSRATDDADGDGQSNLAEFLAGTNPMLATSVFALRQAQVLPGGFQITWASVPGKSYDIQYKSMLTEGWNSLAVNIPATAGSTTSFTDTNGDGVPQRFYRIKLRQP